MKKRAAAAILFLGSFVLLGSVVLSIAAQAPPAPDWQEHADTIIKVLVWLMGILGGGALLLIQWFLLRAVRSVDGKLQTVLVAIFGDGMGVSGILARLQVLEHDYARCCGGPGWDGHERRSGVSDGRREDD